MRTATSILAGALLMIALACGGSDGGPGDAGQDMGGGPGDAVLDMFDALQAGDGEKAVTYMSSSAVDEMNAQVELLRADPEASAEQLALMGIEVDPADIPDMTGAEFASIMISSPMISSIMESAVVTVGAVVIEGNSAMVDVTVEVMGESETNTIEVVREDGMWKVTEFGGNM